MITCTSLLKLRLPGIDIKFEDMAIFPGIEVLSRGSVGLDLVSHQILIARKKKHSAIELRWVLGFI